MKRVESGKGVYNGESFAFFVCLACERDVSITCRNVTKMETTELNAKLKTGRSRRSS